MFICKFYCTIKDKSISVDESGRKVCYEFPLPGVDSALVGSHGIQGLKEKHIALKKNGHCSLSGKIYVINLQDLPQFNIIRILRYFPFFKIKMTKYQIRRFLLQTDPKF